jgi:transcription initiation factor TFIIIB Brf1 subunit/transcription initiation factor TFIIB
MEDKNLCPRCKGKNTRITKYNEGEIVCNECGYIFELEFIDEHPEERFFSKQCSGKGLSNKEISRTTSAPSTYYFGNSNEIKLLCHKKRANFENKFNDYYSGNNIHNEKDKKSIKKNSELNKIDMELRKICDYFNISKMIYEATKEEAIKLYEYGKIHIRYNSNWRLVLGLLINYTLKNKTQSCFSKEEISNYFQCDIDTIKKEAFKIYQILQNSNTITIEDNNQKENMAVNKENKLNNYLLELQKNISFLIKRTRIKTISGITDCYDIIYEYIINNIFNIEVIPPICLAGGSMIFCIKLYKIQFIIKNKNKEVLDKIFSMNTPEEEQKLINYIAKKCSSGISTDKLMSVYERMKKYKNLLKNNDKFKDYLDNLSL